VREKIIKGASELIMQFGIRTVTMDDIAKHLSISKKTIYLYFKDKRELVNMITQVHLATEEERFDGVVVESENAVHEMILVSKCLRDSMQEMKMNIMNELQKFYPEAWELYMGFKQNVMKRSIQDVIERGQKEGHFRNEIDPELIALMRIEQVQAFFMNKSYSTKQYSLVDVQLQLFDHFIHGLFTIDGHKLFNQYITTNTLKNGTQN
jgi:AcrR family transcriptional regulator